MRVVGIDPGLATTGFAVVERGAARLEALSVGAIRTPADLPQAERLAILQEQVAGILRAHRPQVVAVERLFFNSNVRTAMAVAQAAGVILAAAAQASVHVAHYTPTEVKQSVVGTGAATKHQVQAMVTSLLRLDEVPRPPDAADACALAISHLNRSKLAGAISAALA